jgi:Ca2+-binding RTX toxin-like protein
MTLATSGDDVIAITTSDLTSTVELDGGAGTDTLQLNGGGTFDFDFPWAPSSFEIIKGSAADEVIHIWDDYSDTGLIRTVSTFEGGGGNDVLSFHADDLDLRNKTITGFAKIELADYWGTSVTLNNKALALQLTGYNAYTDKVFLEGGTFEAAERRTLFNQGIDEIKDASGTYRAASPGLLNLDETFRLSAGQVANVLLDVGGNALVIDNDDATLNSLWIYHGALSATETVGFRATAKIILSGALEVGCTISVQEAGGPVVIGTIGTKEGDGFRVSFNGNATHARVAELLHALEYKNASVDPSLLAQRDVDIYLGDQGERYAHSVVSITIAPDGVKVLTEAQDQPAGTSGDDVFAATNRTLNLEDELNGGDGVDTLQALNGLGDGTGFAIDEIATFSGIEVIRMTDADDDIIQINAERLSGVVTIDGGAGDGDNISLVGASFDLRGKQITGIERIFLQASDASVVVDNKEVAALVKGNLFENNSLELKGGEFTKEELRMLFENNIRTVIDGKGAHTNQAPTMSNLNGDRISAAVGDTVFIDAGRNVTVADDYAAFGFLGVNLSNSITGYNDDNYQLGIDTSGTVTLSNGVALRSKISVNGTEIGLIGTEFESYLGINFNAGTTAEQVQEVIRALTVKNVSAAGTSLGPHQVRLELSDTAFESTNSIVFVDPAGSPPPNAKPTNLDLKTRVVDELAVVGTTVGAFQVTDPDAGDTFTFALLDDAGGRFRLNDRNELVVADGTKLDYEQAASHSVKVRVTDKGGLSFEKVLTVDVRNVEPESASGTIGADHFVGGVRSDTLSGGGGDDILLGGGGNDRLYGGSGKDVLTGGLGKDVFVFDSAVAKRKNVNIDTIKDFKNDVFWLDNAIYKGLGKKGSIKKPAKLSKDAFFKGNAAHDETDRIIVSKDGKIYYDADGTGSQAKIHIATVNKSAVKAISHADFLVI